METPNFYDSSIKEVYETALKMGLKVFTYKSDSAIKQIFITDGINIGSFSGSYYQSFGTEHKPTHGIGTGFGDIKFNSIEDGIKKSMEFAPEWVTHSDRQKVKKWESAEAYIKAQTILEYYYI